MILDLPQVKHGTVQLEKALLSLVAVVGSQACGEKMPLDAHKECDQTKLQAGTDFLRYSFDLTLVAKVVPKEVVDKMMANHIALKTQWGEAQLRLESLQLSIRQVADLCSPMVAMRQDRTEQNLVAFSSHLSELRSTVAKQHMGADLDTGIAFIEKQCGVEACAQSLYQDALKSYKEKCAEALRVALSSHSGGGADDLDQRVKDASALKFKVMQLSGSSTTPGNDRAAIEFMDAHVLRLCTAHPSVFLMLVQAFPHVANPKFPIVFAFDWKPNHRLGLFAGDWGSGLACAKT